jgi:hypothetical protein
LKLDDGRVLSLRNTALAGVAKLEAMSDHDEGNWRVVYRLTSTRENPFTHHSIQCIEVVFPLTINGKPQPIVKHLLFDTSDTSHPIGAVDDPLSPR